MQWNHIWWQVSVENDNYIKLLKKNKTSVGTMIFWIKINLSSIRLGVLNCFCRAANTTNVAFNHQRPFISQHKEPKVKCCWSSRERVSVCISAHTMMCLCYWENASSFISMRGLSWLSMRRLGPIMPRGTHAPFIYSIQTHNWFQLVFSVSITTLLLVLNYMCTRQFIKYSCSTAH